MKSEELRTGSQFITCPKCKAQIPLTEVLTKEVESRAQRQIEDIIEKKEAELKKQFEAERTKFEEGARKKALQEVSIELTDLKEELREKVKRIDELEKRELSIRKRERELKEQSEQLDAKLSDLEKDLRAKLELEGAKSLELAKKKIRESLEVELHDLKDQVDEKSERIKELQEQELHLRKKQRDLEDKEKALEEKIEQAKADARRELEKEKAKLKEQGRKEAEESAALELTALREQLDQKGKKIAALAGREVELLKKQEELSDREAQLELELRRAVEEEKRKAWAHAQEKVAEDYKFKLAEKDKVIEDTRRQVEDLKRRVEQGSQQLQGEVQELELEKILRAGFPQDEIVAVKTGVKGADVLQNVMAAIGKQAGSILWESKRTKSWDDKWIRKLKDDQRAENAEIAVIVSEALPPTVKGIGRVDGVWVSDFRFAELLAPLLRQQLIEVTQARNALAGMEEKKDLVYQYLSGPEFKQKVEAVVEAFVGLKNDLDGEKRAMDKIWAKRETEIKNVLLNVARMYGNLQAIISLAPIKYLELPAGDGELAV